ncbi:beta strand repeat-containing protein, partial [Portibacter lacus]|uniref:beta strand repeat-containing protein n=2 Tax=Portibacter lacus TaxID=1099794 RepID=UPI0024E0A16B
MKRYIQVLILALLVLKQTPITAEGTPQLSPTINDLALLSINGGFGIASDFAYFGSNGTTQSLCFEVKDASEVVYLGLGLEVNNLGNTGATPGYSFRIVNSSGMVVHTGTVTSANANGNNYNELVNGPNIGAMTGGYDISNAQYVFNPSTSGTYCIEFDRTTFDGSSTGANGGYIRNFDISVANMSGNIIPGRLYAQNWAFRTPCNPSFGCTSSDVFAKSFEGKVYVLTNDNFVQSIDFAGSGFRGLGFRLAFNGSGPGMMGDPELDRQSLNASGSTNPEFKIFVNDPDPNCYEAPILGEVVGSPSIVNQSINCDAASSFCVDVTVGQPGLVQILFDFNLEDQVFTDGTTDRLLVLRIEDGDPLNQCIPWDGMDGQGNAVPVDSDVPILITFYQGEVHFMQSDVEYNNPGFTVDLEHPSNGNFQSFHYWDDTNIDASGDNDPNLDLDNNPATNPPGMAPNPPFVELSGQLQPAHIWNRNTASTSNGYGESNVINTWWFGHASVEGPIYLTPCPTAGVIETTKSIASVPVPASSGIVGNYDVTYQFEICNTGGLPLTGISLTDNFNSQFGSGFVGVTTPPVIIEAGTNTMTADPTVNGVYNGNGVSNLLNSDGGIDGGECITVQLTVEVDASALPSPAENTAVASAADDGEGMPSTDDSDDASDIDGDTNPYNETGADDDPTQLIIPSVSVEKTYSSAVVQPDGDYKLTFDFLVENSGNTYLQNLTLADPLSFLPGADPTTQSFMITVTNISATMAPTATSGTYDGVGNIDILTGTDGFLAPGEQFMVQLMVDVDPIGFGSLAMPVTNQATASGVPTDASMNIYNDPSDGMPYAAGDVSDLSDDSTPGNPDDGTQEDPTPIILPSNITLTKSLVSVTPATTPGNVIATYNFNFCNDGANDLMNIQLLDNFNSQFGSGFVEVSTSPVILPSSTATTAPTLYATYTGFSPNDIMFNGTSGLVEPGQCVSVSFAVEIDLDELPDPADNQGSVSGTDGFGNSVTDLSDDMTAGVADEGTLDDPTPFPLVASINASKALTNTVILSNGNAKLTFDISVENTGNTNLSTLSILDDLSNLGAAYQSGTATISVINGSSTMAPANNTGTFDGTATTTAGGDGDLISGTNTDVLEPGQMYIARLMFEVDPVEFGMLMAADQNNQAQALGIPVNNAGTPIDVIDVNGNAVAAGNTISDLSDDPVDLPDTDEDDVTPITLPGILDLSKQLTSITNPAASAKPGNVDATYTFNICNNGGSSLTGISLIDNFSNEFGSGFVGVTTNPALGTSTATTDPTLAPTFTGFSPNTNLLNGTNGELAPGECVAVTVTIEVDLDLMPDPAENQATAIAEDDGTGNSASDISDNDAPTGTPNGDTTGDDPDDPASNDNDPTPFPPSPSIDIAKSVNMTAAAPTPDHYFITYRHIIKNTGNTPLENITLTDDIATILCGGYVGTTNITVSNIDAATAPTAAASTTIMNGTNDALNNNGLILPGQSFIVDIVVEADITATTCNQPYLNQSTAEGLPTDALGTILVDPATGNPYMDGDITDLSDSGTDPDGSNPGAPNDGNGANIYDDPTPVNLPGTIGLVKTISNVSPATTTGNYLVTMDFYIENTDGNNLTNIALKDMLKAQWGSAFVGVTTPPSIFVAGTVGTTIDPTPNAAYNGDLDSELLNMDGELAPGESITVRVVVEVNASESLASGLENQATVTGTDPNGNLATDLSDDNTSSVVTPDADGDNPNGSGDDGAMGTNNPTPLYIPEISNTKEIVNTVEAASGIAGNFDVTYQIIVANTGTTPLEMIALTDDIATQLAPAYVGITTEAIITSSSASTNPVTSSMPNLLDGTAGVLLPGESVTLQIVVEIDASLVPVLGLTNQSTATGNPTDGMGNDLPDPNNPGMDFVPVTDDSDSGSDPEGNNIGEPGDMGTPDDPTPLPPLPAIELLKAVTGVVPASSGVQGNFDVTYTYTITNTGNADLNGVSLQEDFEDQYGSAFVGIIGTPVTAPAAGLDLTYVGSGFNTEVLDGSLTLVVGATQTVSIVAEINPDAPGSVFNVDGELENQASTSATDINGTPVMDDSDDNTPGNMDDGTNADPTPLALPSISVTKALTDVTFLNDSIYQMTFAIKVLNTGNEDLETLPLIDVLDYPILTSSVTIIKQPTIGTIASNGSEEGGSYTGISPAPTNRLTSMVADGDTLAIGDYYEVQVILTAHVDSLLAVDPLENQARAAGTGVNSGIQAVDDSDDGTGLDGNGDPSTDNAGAPGDTGDTPTFDDPTPIPVPRLEVVKTSDLAEITVAGDVITYTFTVTNTGNTDLDDLTINDNGPSFGGAAGTNSLVGLTCDMSDLNPGGVATCTATYTVSQADFDNATAGDMMATNIATGTATPPGFPPLTSQPDTLMIPVTATPMIVVDKTASPPSTLLGANPSLVDAGDQITYTYNVMNTGNTVLTAISVSDAGPTFSGSAATGTLSPITCSAINLAPGQNTSCSATYTLSQEDIDNALGEVDSVVNIAFANGTPPGLPPITSVPDTAMTTVPATPSLLLVKDVATPTMVLGADPLLSDGGDQIDYTFTLTNTGNVNLTDVSVEDSGPLFNTIQGTNGALAIDCPVIFLAPGASVECTSTYTMSQADVDNAAGILEGIVNGAQASGTPPSDDPVPPMIMSNIDSAKTTIPAGPMLMIQKLVTAPTFANGTDILNVDAGDIITYTYVITNTGNVGLTGVVPVDAGPSFGGILGTNSLSAYMPTSVNLAPGANQTFTATYILSQADVDNGTGITDGVVNIAIAQGLDPMGMTVISDPDDAVTQFETLDSLSIVKSADLAEITMAGDVITYSFLVTNIGGTTIDNVSITDAGPSFGGAAGTNSLQGLSCPLTTLAPTESTTCAATYTVSQADFDNAIAGDSSAMNIAIANGTPPVGPPVMSIPDTLDIPVVPFDSISIVKTAGLPTISSGANSTVVDAGDMITYTYLITNAGTTNLTDVSVSDAGPTFMSVPGTNVLSVITCNIDELAPGESTSCTATYTLSQLDIDNSQGMMDSVVNIAVANGTPPAGPPIMSEPDTAMTTVPNMPLLTINKTASAASVTEGVDPLLSDGGDYVDYTFEVTNEGNVTLTDVIVTDLGPLFNGTLGDNSPLVVDCGGTIDLPPGESVTCTSRYIMTQTDVNNAAGVADGIRNGATATGTTPIDTLITTPPDSAFTSLPSGPMLSLVKTASPVSITEG